MGAKDMNTPDESEQMMLMAPVYFALSSSGRSVERKDVLEEEWEEVLDANDLTAEEFDQYEKWWWSPEGSNLIRHLQKQFQESIMPKVPVAYRDVVLQFLEEPYWRDFICELSDCSEEDADYFNQYAVEQGLFYNRDFEALNEAGLDEEEFSRILKEWYLESKSLIQAVFIESYTVISKILSK